MQITKQGGGKENFDREKLYASLIAAGSDATSAEKICSKIEGEFRPGMSTSRLFRRTLSYLVKESIDLAARYSLRRGMAALGPSGFVFEQYLEALLVLHDYQVQRNQIMEGGCGIVHEIDLLAKKDDIHYIIEAKYRNDIGIKTHIDVVMYAKARMDDIAENQNNKGDHKEHVSWLMTNTKFTSSSTIYAECKGMKLTGWSYPKGDDLEKMIVEKKAYPITVLPAVTRFARDQFIKHNMLLVQDLAPYSIEQFQKDFSLPRSVAEKIHLQVSEIVTF